MPNRAGNAYGLTTLCPIRNSRDHRHSLATLVRDHLESLGIHEDSPMAAVPNTYLCRFYVLDDVFYEMKPAKLDHLKSKYLVFASNFHGDRDTYLRGMWQHAESFVRETWQHCVGFARVQSAESFIEYIEACQVKTTLFFMGSTDVPLEEQLKSLYLKQEFSSFVAEHQGLNAEELQQAFQEFAHRVEPRNLAGPTWKPGAHDLESTVTST
ncbi:MAG: hypothetical protein O3A00_20630 [Planctomycetota bacterium]|nr:hypothetical protein [Planctomycetota bacterium]